MPLTALDIYKHLPKKNCGECGVPTCLAFAMQLASLKGKLDACPYVTEDVKNLLASAAAPPVHLVKIGIGENEVSIGNETVLFRHDKTFVHPTAYAVVVNDNLAPEEMNKKVEQINNFKIDRVGQTLRVNMIAVKSLSNEPAKFASAVELIQKNTTLPLILMSEKSEVIEAGVKHCCDKKPLIYTANTANIEQLAKIAKEYNCSLTITAANIDELANLSEKAKNQNMKDIVLDIGKPQLAKALETLTVIRRLAIKKTFRPLGYPVICILDAANSFDACTQAAIYTMKYCSVIVFETVNWSMLLPLFALRQNIFTDPQKPIQVKAGIYEIGTPTEHSPVFVTTNFSLTYFTVAGDIEKSKIPSWLLVADTEGLSVMTAFAADKFTPEIITKLIEDTGIKNKVAHNKLIIPGMVARMTMKLKELTGREILVGPRDSSGIPGYLKEVWR